MCNIFLDCKRSQKQPLIVCNTIYYITAMHLAHRNDVIEEIGIIVFKCAENKLHN